MSPYRRQVAAALEAVRILGDTRYSWLGSGSRPLPEGVHEALDAGERRDYLVACLREELYASFYCHGSPVPARWGEPQPVAGDPWLLSALSEANGGRGRWESGWTVDRIEGDEAVVVNGRLRGRVPVGDCRGPLRPGTAVGLRAPKEQPSLSPGFYTAIGDADGGAGAGAGAVVRVYWSVARAGAPPLMRALTSGLNADGVPFRLKVANHPSRLDRCDAAVLYLPLEAFGMLRATLRKVALSSRLRSGTPAFTLELVPGVGLAEDDGAGESFGVRRCALLADGIVRAHEQRTSNALDVVAGRFAEEGVDLDAPYREPTLAGHHVL
jgi:HopA1 effector protein family